MAVMREYYGGVITSGGVHRVRRLAGRVTYIREWINGAYEASSAIPTKRVQAEQMLSTWQQYSVVRQAEEATSRDEHC